MVAKDNTTFSEKVALRRLMLGRVKKPVVLEAFGGVGHLWAACYASLPIGVVFEKQLDRALFLARQRPTWAVYKADCVLALQAGAGDHLTINVLDLDPYGNPWPAIAAFFESDRPRAKKLSVVVTDGLMLKMKLGGAWSVEDLRPAVEKYGNWGVKENYLLACREMMEEQAAKAGYSLAAWTGYLCGKGKQMAHYLAELQM